MLNVREKLWKYHMDNMIEIEIDLKNVLPSTFV